MSDVVLRAENLGKRYRIGGTTRVDGVGLVLNLCTVAVLLWLGLGYFRRTEREFADVI